MSPGFWNDASIVVAVDLAVWVFEGDYRHWDQAHHRLARLHRKLKAAYDGPDMPPPPKPKWMRWKTYTQIAAQIETGPDRLEAVFTAGAQRILARLERKEQPARSRR